MPQRNLLVEREPVAGGGDVAHMFPIPEDGFPAPWPGVSVWAVLCGVQEQHDQHAVDPLRLLLDQRVAANEVNVSLGFYSMREDKEGGKI